MVVTSMFGQFRIQHKGCFIGTDYPGADYTLHIADEALEREGCERDSVGYVFATRIEATIAMREADKAVRSFEREQGSQQAVG